MLPLIGALWRHTTTALARLLRDLTTVIEGAAAASLPPAELSARLREQLGREPTPAELRMLLDIVHGLQGSLSLDGVPEEQRAELRAMLASYAEGLRRDLGNAGLGNARLGNAGRT